MENIESLRYWNIQKEIALKALATAERRISEIAVREFVSPTVVEVTPPRHVINHDTFIDDLSPMGELIQLRPKPYIEDDAA